MSKRPKYSGLGLRGKPSLFLLTLTLWCWSLGGWALAQPINVSGIEAQGAAVEICTSLEDMRRAVQTLKECEIDRRELELLREQGILKDQRIALLEKEIELLKREGEIKDRIIQLKDMEIAAQARAIKDLKEISDRAIKLAEVGKKNGWSLELQGLLGLMAFLAGFALAR